VKRVILAAILGSSVWGFATAVAASGAATPAAAAPKTGAGCLAGKPIWDLSRVRDREKTRLEFPCLIRFKGAWYCAFRVGEIHNNHPSGRGRIIRSADGEAWESVALLEWDGGDVREPKFSITAEGALMVNTSVYFVSKKPRADGSYYRLDRTGTILNIPYHDAESHVVQQSVTWLSTDGRDWGTVCACPSGVNGWRWSVTWHNGMGYSVAHSGKDIKGTLYRTRDGRSWRVLKAEFFPDGKGNEAALAFGADDTACCLLRSGRTRAMIGIGKPPYYQEWQWKDSRVDYGPEAGGPRPAGDVLRVDLGGPKLVRLSDGRLLGAGRALGPGRDDGRATLFWVDPDKAVLTKFVEFDGTSYPGVVEYEGMLWVTYVGSAYRSDKWEVHLAKVRIPQ